MSAILVCPECDKKLRVPDTVMGKAFRCPACKALIPPASEPDSPAPSRAVKQSPSPRNAAVPSRGRPVREEAPEDDLEPEEEQDFRDKPRKKRPKRKQSSAGLIIGLLAGGAVLLLLVLGGGGGLLWYFLRDKAISNAEWPTFTPPGGDCTVLMPDTPAQQTMSNAGISGNQYILGRKNGKEAFGLVIFELPPQVLRSSLMEDIANAYSKAAMDSVGGGQATTTKPITLGSLPGLEFQGKLTTRRGGLMGRIYLAKVGNRPRAYLLAMLSESIQLNTDDAARFLDSFKITASATAPDLTGAAGQGGMQKPPGFNPPPANPQPNPPPGFRRPRLPGRP